MSEDVADGVRPARPTGETASGSTSVSTGRVVLWLVVALLCAPAALLTAARASSVESGPVIRLVAFTPLAIPLWTIVVLLLVGSLLGRRARPTGRLAACAVAVLGLGLQVGWFAPQVVGSGPQPAPGAAPTTIMNANLYFGEADAAQVVAAVRRHHVDILVVEEITPTEETALEASGLGTVLPYQAGQADPSSAGTMVFADQPITDVVDLHTDLRSYRVTVAGLTLIAAHPRSPVYPSGWVADHATIRDAAVSGDADVIVGNLNATPDHTVLHELGEVGYRDVAEEANQGWQPTWPSNHLGVPFFVPPVVRIDHVLVASTLTGLSTTTVHVDGTDHLALIARVAPAAAR